MLCSAAQFTGRRLSYILIAFIFLVSPITIDTYLRLGVVENAFVFVLVCCINCVFRKRYSWLVFWPYMFLTSPNLNL